MGGLLSALPIFDLMDRGTHRRGLHISCYMGQRRQLLRDEEAGTGAHRFDSHLATTWHMRAG